MAKFGEKIFDFKEVLKFFRIPVSCLEDKCFLNVGKNSIVKVYDQKPVHTWTLMHPHHFTNPVIYSREKVYCVKDDYVLMVWLADEDNLMNAVEVQFQEPIFAVISLGEQLLVLFNSGKYAINDSTFFASFEQSDLTFLKENEEFVWADASETTDAFEVFCLVYNKKSQKRIIYYFTVNKDDKDASNLCMKNLSHEEASLKAWCLNHHESSLLSVWSDGTICCHNVKESKDSKLLSLKNIDVNTIVDIESIDSTHIIVARSSLKRKECILEIWDSKCAVLKARKVLKTANLVHMQIITMDSKLFLSHNEELAAVAFYIENSTLSAAVGKSVSESNKILEYSWDTKTELLQVPSVDEPEAMEVCDQELINNVDSVEAIAQKLLSKNSEYLLCIRESELAKLLQLAIRYKNEESDHENSSEKETYAILNIIFSASFNDILLVKYLKKLNSDEILIALELLLSYLNQTVQLPSDIGERPSDLQIVNWTLLIIQSHVEYLLFSKDKTSRKLLKQLKKALSVKTEEYEDFECIQNYFSVIEKKDMLPQKCSVGKYCVESLDI